MGHVMRCLALAKALEDADYSATFACRSLAGDGIALIRERGFYAEEIDADDMQKDAEATQALAETLGVKTILVDLSHADTLAFREGFIGFLRTLTAADFQVAVIEGMNEECISLNEPLPVAAVIIPYFGASEYHYKLAPQSCLFAGETFFPLRAEFLSLATRARKVSSPATRILVAIGGGNVDRLNRQVVEALARLERDRLEVKVLGVIAGPGDFPLQVEVIPYASNMAELIAWADCAVIGSGLMRYEVAYVGTPSIVFSLNAEHARMVQDFAKTGAALAGGVFSETSSAMMADAIRSLMDDKVLRASMAAIGPTLIDGKGAARLVAAFPRFN